MKRFLIFLALIALLVIPASATVVNLTPSSVVWNTTGADIPEAYDGNTATHATIGGADLVSIKLSYPVGTDVIGCNYYSKQASSAGIWYSDNNGAKWLTKTGVYGFTPPYATLNKWAYISFSTNATTFPLYFHQDYRTIDVGEIYCRGVYPGTIANPINFTGTPRTGDAPLTVTFDDNSTNIQSSWSWDFGDGSTITNVSTPSTTHTYDYPGTYDVSLWAYNASLGWGYKKETGFIVATGNVTGIMTEFQAVDGKTGGLVDPVSIMLRDVESNTWSNTSGSTTSTWNITTPLSHLIDAYATAPGYYPTSKLGVSPSDVIMYELIMQLTADYPIPGSGGPGDPGTGNVNLIVEVNDRGTQDPVDGATVTITGPTGQVDIAKTGAAGTATLVATNMSVYRVDVSKSGHIGAAKITTTTAFGPDTVRVEIDKRVVTTEPTLAPGVTPTETVLPGCEDPTSDTCYAAQDRALMNDLRGYMKLLGPLFVIAIVLWLFAPKTFR